MIQGTLKKPDGSDLVTFDIPSDLKEVKLSAYIDFLIHCREFDETEATAIATMAKAVSAFLGVDLEKLLQASAGLYNAPESSFSGSIMSLYGYIVKLIGDFKPQVKGRHSEAFTYKGEKYYIPGIVEQAIKGEFILPELSVMEVIEVAEITKWREGATKNIGDRDGALRKKITELAGMQIKENGGNDPDGKIAAASDKLYKMELERAGDPDGSLAFSYYLRTLAVLCRKKDELMPHKDSEREAWIQQRAAHFQDIDAATAMEADFFLSSTLPFSERRPAAVGFLKNSSFAIVAATRLRSEKRGNAQLSSRKKRSKR
ncbi:MAG: hypothetical protein ACRCVX_00010 [Shewanella sp.]